MIRVMIVATYIEIREGLSTVLRLAENIEIVATAASLEEALAAIPAADPDIALVDMEMPGREGLEVVRQIPRCSPRIQVIALTAHDYPAARESAIRAGARAVLVKGVGVAEMAEAVHMAAGRKPREQGNGF